MEGHSASKPVRIVLIVVLALVVLVGALGIGWWRTMSRLSTQSAAIFASEIDRAARDSLVTRADLDLLKDLQSISGSKDISTPVRGLIVGVGMAPLLRGSLSDADRQDMIAVRDLVRSRQGALSAADVGRFLKANPRIQQTFRSFRFLVGAAGSRRTIPG